MSGKDEFTVGIEEEFFLVDGTTFECVDRMPDDFHRQAKRALGDKVKREVISSMIEINSGVHRTVPAALAEIATLREELSGIAHDHGLSLVAAGTHPLADWRDQSLTRKERYFTVAAALQMLAKRIHVCGLHIHLSVLDRDSRIDLMNRSQRFLPLFLALSSSSPFWRGAPTGLKGYRVAANAESPRSGLPGWFANADEFDRYVGKLVEARFIADASYLWWHIRPSCRYPTLELRVTDCCTRLRDVGALAALYQSLLHHLKTNSSAAREWEHHHHLIIEENLWQAIRNGTNARFVNPASGEITTAAGWARDLVAMVSSSARQLDCLKELLGVADIIAEGSSADMQLRLFDQACTDGATRIEAARYVAGQLARLTAPAAPVGTH